MLDVVTLGETMVVMDPDETGSLKYIYRFNKKLAGAESNVAIGLSRLGFKTGWISRLGDDPHGEYIRSFIMGEGVDTSQVKIIPGVVTGVFFKEIRELEETKVYYYRKNSAASTMEPEDLDEGYIAQAKYLHITGITPALSESCYRTILRAIEIAQDNDVKIVIDPNLRFKLWSKEKMTKTILELFQKADIVLPGIAEGETLLGTNNPEEIAKRIMNLGPKKVIVKLGSKGSLAADRNTMEYVEGFKVEKVVDPIGAGDGFAAGFIAGQLKGYGLIKSTELANAVGAFAITVRGDVEGLPKVEELQVFMGQKKDVDR